MRPVIVTTVVLVGAVLLYGGWWYLYPRSERKALSAPADNMYQEPRSERKPLPADNMYQEPITNASLKNSLRIDLVVVPYFSYKASHKSLLDREKEYMTCLQRNLNHNLVSRVHVLTSNTEGTRQIFQKYELSNQAKLLVPEIKSIVMVRDIFEYISQNLVGKDVMFTNADIWLGSGFDRVDPIVMRKQKVFYSITRRIANDEERCGQKDFCLEWKYIGCHDTFLFSLHEPIPEDALKLLNVKFPAPGIEEVLMWVFQNKLGYCVLNPCSILETFHFHCSGLRNHYGWKRVNINGISSYANFTKKLVCK